MFARFLSFIRGRLLPASVLILLAAAMPGCDPKEKGNGPLPTPAGPTTPTYVANLHGDMASAQVSFERLREYTLMAGEVRSNVAYSTFTAEIYGNSGFGTMVDHVGNERFQIKIDLTRTGFKLTSNPFGPGRPTTYDFVRK